MDFDVLKRRYKQFGGFRLIIAYTRLGVVGTIIRAFFSCMFHKRSFKTIYPEIGKNIDGALIDRYLVDIPDHAYESKYDYQRCIWWCWLQGEENAPEIVKACLSSLRKNIIDREIRIIDAENWREYIELPEFIIEKWQKGRIPAAMFTDILRLELLIRYGGTWIDATVLCTIDQTDDEQRMQQKMQEYLDSDLFLYQYTHPKGGSFGGCSNWFISSKPNSSLLTALRDSIYGYWREYDCVVEYYIFHRFFSELVRRHPELIANMPYGYSCHSLVLMKNWNRPYDEGIWKDIANHVVFHKLSFRVKQETIMDEGNLYHEILRRYSHEMPSR